MRFDSGDALAALAASGACLALQPPQGRPTCGQFGTLFCTLRVKLHHFYLQCESTVNSFMRHSWWATGSSRLARGREDQLRAARLGADDGDKEEEAVRMSATMT